MSTTACGHIFIFADGMQPLMTPQLLCCPYFFPVGNEIASWKLRLLSLTLYRDFMVSTSVIEMFAEGETSKFPDTNHKKPSVSLHTLAPTTIWDLSHSVCGSPQTDLGHISSVTYVCHPLWFVCGHRKGILMSPLNTKCFIGNNLFYEPS